MDRVNKSAFFARVKDFLDSDGIELVKYSNGKSLSNSDYFNLFRIIVQSLIGVCVEEQKPVKIDGLCEAGFNVETGKFEIMLDESVQTKLENNKSIICNELLVPVRNEDVVYMLNESKVCEVIK